jgi:hypothetical protein
MSLPAETSATADSRIEPPVMQAPESRIGIFLRRGLYLSAGTFLALLLIVLAVFALNARPPGDWFGYALAISLGCSGVFGIARFAYVLFTQLQARLSEWMVTFIYAALLVPVAKAFLKYVGARLRDDQVFEWLIVMMFCIVAAVLGSMWGWSASKRLAEEDPWTRFTLLGRGWLLIFGLVGVTFVLLLTALGLAEAWSGGRMPSEFWEVYFKFALLGLLAVPGILIEIKIRALRRAGR